MHRDLNLALDTVGRKYSCSCIISMRLQLKHQELEKFDRRVANLKTMDEPILMIFEDPCLFLL